jgi:hypothetical protein
MKPFCMTMVKDVIKERENSNHIYKDLIQHLIQLRHISSSKGKDKASGENCEDFHNIFMLTII